MKTPPNSQCPSAWVAHVEIPALRKPWDPSQAKNAQCAETFQAQRSLALLPLSIHAKDLPFGFTHQHLCAAQQLQNSRPPLCWAKLFQQVQVGGRSALAPAPRGPSRAAGTRHLPRKLFVFLGECWKISLTPKHLPFDRRFPMLL